jgi:hypothetical protein
MSLQTRIRSHGKIPKLQASIYHVMQKKSESKSSHKRDGSPSF